MTINEAFNIARSKNSELVPLQCTELKDMFCFFMVNQRGEPVVNGSTYTVNKTTGKCEWKSLFKDNILREHPIKEYSERDLKAITRQRSAYRNASNR